MSFLPEDYKVPAGDNKYMKFAPGENVFRVLSDAITGWEWWTTEMVDGKEVRRPNRVSDEGGIPVEEYDDENPPRHFWAFVVWNYTDKRIQILEITQRTIQRAIMALSRSKGWGDPKNYDVSVTKTGEGKETEYSIMPVPPKPLDEEIKKKYESMKINLDALYLGEDPFTSEAVDPDKVDAEIKKSKK